MLFSFCNTAWAAADINLAPNTYITYGEHYHEFEKIPLKKTNEYAPGDIEGYRHYHQFVRTDKYTYQQDSYCSVCCETKPNITHIRVECMDCEQVGTFVDLDCHPYVDIPIEIDDCYMIVDEDWNYIYLDSWTRLACPLCAEKERPQYRDNYHFHDPCNYIASEMEVVATADNKWQNKPYTVTIHLDDARGVGTSEVTAFYMGQLEEFPYITNTVNGKLENGDYTFTVDHNYDPNGEQGSYPVYDDHGFEYYPGVYHIVVENADGHAQALDLYVGNLDYDSPEPPTYKLD